MHADQETPKRAGSVTRSGSLLSPSCHLFGMEGGGVGGVGGRGPEVQAGRVPETLWTDPSPAPSRLGPCNRGDEDHRVTLRGSVCV